MSSWSNKDAVAALPRIALLAVVAKLVLARGVRAMG